MFAYCGNNPVVQSDPFGKFGWFTIANAFIGAVVSAATQIATNIATGEHWYNGVAGAAVGGAVYNVVALTTGNLVAASAASTAAEGAVNEIGTYITGEKDLTVDNLLESVSNVAVHVASDVVITAVTGKIASNVIKTNKGWFQPKKLMSSFTGKYAKKVWKQTAVQGGAIFVIKTAQGWMRKISST